MPPDASAIGGRAVTVRWMGHEKKVVHAPGMGISVALILGQICKQQGHSGRGKKLGLRPGNGDIRLGGRMLQGAPVQGRAPGGCGKAVPEWLHQRRLQRDKGGLEGTNLSFFQSSQEVHVI